MDQTPPRHPLDPVLDFLEGRHADSERARKVLRNFISDPASPPHRLLVQMTATVVRPLFRGSQERQGEIDRLLDRLRQGCGTADLPELGAQIRTFAEWIKAKIDEEATARRLYTLLPRLMHALRVLGSGEPKVEDAAQRLLGTNLQRPNAALIDKVGQFATYVIDAGRGLHRAWQEERQAYLRLVSELASQLEEMRQNTGGIGRRLSDSIGRLKSSQSMEELKQLRIVLVREAEDLVHQTQEMYRQLTDTQQQLTAARSQMEQLAEELQQTRADSLTDPLTGVPNRRSFMEQLEREMARSLRHQLPLSLIMLDLDHFKKINDTYGHIVGDKVLIITAGEVKRLIRQSDLLARYGGEEFILMLPETDLEEARQVAEKIRTGLDILRLRTHQFTISVTASLGVARWDPERHDADQWINVADQALYQAKQGGRNQVVVASQGVGQETAATA